MLVYDITNKESFEALDKWLEEINNYSSENISICLIGNKKDLES